jgi:bacterioferritin-associated ferredoxin
MYVCLCRAVTDKAIKQAVENGCDTFREVRDELDVGTCCGMCVPETRHLIDETLAKLASSLSTAA